MKSPKLASNLAAYDAADRDDNSSEIEITSPQASPVVRKRAAGSAFAPRQTGKPPQHVLTVRLITRRHGAGRNPPPLPPPPPLLTLDAAAQACSPGASKVLVIDVRDSDFAGGHIRGARNISG